MSTWGRMIQIQISAPNSIPGVEQPEFQFFLIQGGAGNVTHRGLTAPTPSGSLFMIQPGEVHSNECTDPEGCSYKTIFLAPEIFSDSLDLSSQPPATVSHDERLIDAFLELFDHFEASESRLELDSALAGFIWAAAGSTRTQDTPASRSDQPGLSRALEYLRESLDENVSLDRLASMAQMSRFTFCRAFAARYGMPPHLCQNQLRVNKAKELLRGGMPIGEVALTLGFADQSHLTKAFRRLTGVTPGPYARLGKNVQD